MEISSLCEIIVLSLFYVSRRLDGIRKSVGRCFATAAAAGYRQCSGRQEFCLEPKRLLSPSLRIRATALPPPLLRRHRRRHQRAHHQQHPLPPHLPYLPLLPPTLLPHLPIMPPPPPPTMLSYHPPSQPSLLSPPPDRASAPSLRQSPVPPQPSPPP